MSFLRNILAKRNAYIETGAIIIMTPPHTLYVARMLKKLLNDSGINTFICNEFSELNRNFFHIVICAQIFKHLPPRYCAYQLEQSVSSRWFNDRYYQILRGAEFVIDYSQVNLDFLIKNGFERSKLFYLPVGPTLPLTQNNNSKTIDLLFYGDVNIERRKRILSELKNNWNVSIVSNLFGDEMEALIQKSKFVLNIHYYEGALLETTRIFEVLSLGTQIISETCADQDFHNRLSSIVKFVEEGNLDAFNERISNELQSFHDRDLSLDLEPFFLETKYSFETIMRQGFFG